MAREDFSIEELESLRGLLATAVGGEGDVAVERIADSFFGLSALFEADFEHIYDVCQSTAVANAIRLAVALHKRRLTEHIKFNKRYSEEQIKDYLKGLFFGLAVENVYVLAFGASGQLLCAECISQGTVNSSGILPRMILDIAKRRSATSVMLAHNHPCGFSEPSCEDVYSTEYIKNVLETAGIELLAHYVVAYGSVSNVMDTEEFKS
jgi:DNA repair protein RadC